MTGDSILKYLLAVFFALLPTLRPLAQGQPIRNLTLRDGLSGISVTGIDNASNGQVWVATSNGVDLYNSHTVISYGFERTDNSNIFCYATDVTGDGTVYAATSEGLYMLRPFADNFVRTAPDIASAECILAYGDNVYVGNRNGLFLVEKGHKTIRIGTGRGVNANNSVRCIRLSPDGNIWFSTRNALNILNPHTGKTRHIDLRTESGLSRFEFCRDKVFVGTKNNGLLVMPRSGGKARKVEGPGNIICNITSRDGRVFVATDGTGAFVINAATLITEQHYGIEEPPERHLPSDAVYTFNRDRAGIDWIGMYRHGLSHTTLSHALFRTYVCGSFSSEGIDIMSFCNTPHYLMLASIGRFTLVDKERHSAHTFATSSFNASLLKCIGYAGGRFYIGTYDAGLLRFDPSSGRLGRIDKPDAAKLEYASVSGITRDRKGCLWVSTSEGLYSIDSNENIRNYNENNSKLPMGARNMLFDPNGNGWIGTANGVCIYLAEGNIIKNSDFPQKFFNRQSITFSQAGSTIYAYSGRHIYYTDPEMRDFGEMSLPDGIIGELCSDFMRDRFGTFWIVSEKGLFAYKAATGSVFHFGPYLGFDCSTVNPQTMSLDGNTLWIGTDNGLKYADIRQVYRPEKNLFDIKAAVDAVELNGVRLGRGRAMEMNDRHTLSITWNLKSQRIELTPIATDFSGNSSKVYEYAVDNGGWKRIFGEGRIKITGLLPGRHDLRLRISGVPSTETAYAIAVYPSTAAWAELLMLAVAIAAAAVWRRQHSRTKELLLEHAETEQALIEENRIAKKSVEEKYQKSRSSDRELARLAHAMETYLKEQRSYLNQELKMSDIASALKVSPSMMSQVFSLYLKDNYYDYINALRLEEFKRRIAKGDHKRLTIKAISEECGFKKTSFFSTFRKREGITPTEYIKNLK